jgi:hypothetical protein
MGHSAVGLAFVASEVSEEIGSLPTGNELQGFPCAEEAADVLSKRVVSQRALERLTTGDTNHLFIGL